MRKGLFFWFSILLTAAIIGGSVYFLGKTPEKVLDVVNAIPSIEKDSPYLFLVSEGSQLDPGFPDSLIEQAEPEARPTLRAIDDLLPLFSFAERSAALVAWESNELLFYSSFMLPQDIAADMASGKLPVQWMENSSGITLGPSRNEGFLQLSVGNGQLVFTVLMKENMMLAALSRESVELMSRVLEGSEEKIGLVFELESSWPAHMKIFDGGLAARAAALRGLKVTDVPLSLEMAWKDDGENGDMAWKLDGIREFIPQEILARLKPHGWKENVYLPDPLIAAAGIAVPGGLDVFADSRFDIPGWMLDAGISRESLDSLTPGPMVMTAGGQSRVFLFSLPGFLLQLPGRGAQGIDWVQKLWSTRWAGWMLAPKPMEGFPAGGMISIPVSLVAAASEDLAIAGVMDPRSIDKTLPVSDLLSPFTGDSIFWMFADFPKAADALEKLARIGDLADRFGLKGSSTPEEMLAAAEEMRSLGQVRIVFHDVDTGRGSWKGASPYKK